MHTFWVGAIVFGLSLLPASAPLPPNYQQALQQARKEQAQAIDAPNSWLSLVALTPLLGDDVSVGSAPGTTVHLEHGPAHAFTLHTANGKVTLAAVDPSLTLNGRHLHPGDTLPVSDADDASLHWGELRANAIRRTGNQLFLRVGDPDSPNRRSFHGLHFYSVDPAYRIVGKWVPYTTPHEIHMSTEVGSVLTVPSPGYVEFSLEGKTVRLDGMDANNGAVTFSFRDATYRTTTYGAGRHVTAERPSNGLQAPGSMLIDFNLATNWPCAYTEYGTCPLPPEQNRFNVAIPAGEKRYHD